MPRRKLWLPGLALVSCASPRPVEAPGSPPSPPSAAPSASAEPKPEVAPGSEANAVVAEALMVVTRRRELAAKGPVKGKTISRPEMVAFVKRELQNEVPAPVIAAQNEMLFALGVVGESFDYEKSLLELMGSQLAGFYDPKEKSMFLARDLPPMERDATLAHELVHALQDQHYDLEARIKFREDAGDEQSAIHALAEGDATSAMLDHVLSARGLRAIDVSEDVIALEARGSMELSMEAANVPSILKRSVISPYIDGLIFVNWARRRGGWAQVDAIWKDLPTTTEQLLHPEKLLAREKAETLPLPKPRSGWPSELMYRDVQGEQSLRLLFEEWMPRRAAAEGASAWSGDRVAVFRSGQRFALAWHVRYDTEAAARTGLESFARGVLRPEGSSEFVDPALVTRQTKGQRLCSERATRGPFAVVRSGRDLGVVAGPFERSAGGAKSQGSCTDALVWATSVAKQR